MHDDTPRNMWNEATATRHGYKRTTHESRDRTHAIRALQAGRLVVYAIRTRHDRLIKIGCTADLAKRRGPLGDEILGFMFGDYADEKAIHDQLKPFRARGWEYYHDAPEVIAVVNAMREKFNLPPLAA